MSPKATEQVLPFDYNTQRPRLIIPEYGRHVQRMVEHCMTVEDRAERTRLAKAIIHVIGFLSPQLRNNEDGDRTLWDHLYIMSEFKLDVDGPFPKPSPEELESKPSPVPYPKTKIKYGHYGKMVERFIAKCDEMEAGPVKDHFTTVIANIMKKHFVVWNRDSISDGTIIKDLHELSGGKLRLAPDAQLVSAQDIQRLQQSGPRNVEQPQRRGGGGGGKKRYRNKRKNRLVLVLLEANV
ncbi:MAG: DUF4290 domain-containing protein [Flavobacteriales bacterium]|nr:DUF4290 domain-containing protein [Flavobacteriales bacterium]